MRYPDGPRGVSNFLARPAEQTDMTRTTILSSVPALLAVVVAAALGCGGSSFANSEKPAASETDSGASGTSDAGGEAGIITGAPPGCDGSALPTADPCVIHEGLGVFVSSSLGTAEGDGSRGKPLKSLQKAIESAAASQKRVYACAETYAESLVLASGVSIFGYFDCANGWALAAGKRAELKAPSSPAVKATNINAPTRVEAFTIEAPAATTPGASSVGVYVADSNAELSFVISRIVAKNGANGGKVGAARTALANANTITGGQNVATGKCTLTAALCRVAFAPGEGGTNACGGGINGGPGGRGGLSAKGTVSGGTLTIDEPQQSGQGGTAETAAGGSGTSAGQAGATPANGTDGASSTGGTFTAAGFVTGDGKVGADGKPGQGGGGGNGGELVFFETNSDGVWYGPSGTGGGAGGCPGLATEAGQGGGASIGVFSWLSVVKLDGTAVEAGDGGAGGAGSTGTAPTPGGNAGNNVAAGSLHARTLGGKGGAGSYAGTSGHGAGGPSYGIVYKGAAPSTGTVVPTFGKGGAGKDQIAFTAAPFSAVRNINASSAGAAQAVYAIP